MFRRWLRLRPMAFELALSIIMILALVIPAIAGSAILPGSFTVKLTISDVKATGIGFYSATISWETNGNATSWVFYDRLSHAATADYVYQQGDNNTLSSQHQVYVNGLNQNTTYYYRVKSVSGSGSTEQITISEEYTFQTRKRSSTGEPVHSPTPLPSPSPSPVTTPVIEPTPTATPVATPATPAPTLQPTPSLTPEPAPTPSLTPTPVIPVTEYERVIAWIDTQQPPQAFDTQGNPLNVTGSFIILSEKQGVFSLIIPVALPEGAVLRAFTDASGLTFVSNRLEVPASSAMVDKSLLLITGDSGDLGTEIVIITGDVIGTGTQAVASVISFEVKTQYTTRDFSAENPALGQVSSAVHIWLNSPPDQSKINITTVLQPGTEGLTAFRLAAAAAGLDEFAVAYTINIEKSNLENGKDIASAVIIMAAGRAWVEAHGGPSAIRIIRFDPQSGKQQVLSTTFMGYDAQDRAVFEGQSPDGPSDFGLIGLPDKFIMPWWLKLLAALAVLICLFILWLLFVRRRRRRQSGTTPSNLPAG